MATSFLIYALLDPTTRAVRYIGKSSTGLKRPGSHRAIKKLARDPTKKGDWIRSLQAQGLFYAVGVLEEVEMSGRLEEAEIRWIAHGRAEGWPLLNMTDGGDGRPAGYRLTEEQRIRMKLEWATGKRVVPEGWVEKLRAMKIGVPRSEETKAKIRATLRGRKPSAAARAKMRAARLGRPPNNAGKPVSAETRAKMSAAQRGKKMSPEACAKISASKLGVPRPDLAAWNKTPAGAAHRERLRKLSLGRPRPDLADLNRRRAARRAARARA